MKRIILDTSFIVSSVDFKVDIFSELGRICVFNYEVCIIDKTIDELNEIIDNQKGKNRVNAKIAKEMFLGKVKILKEKGEEVDDILVKLSDSENIIATQDKELKKRIKGRKITIRQKKYLDFE